MSARSDGPEDDWIIASDAVLRLETRTITGSVIIKGGAKLQMFGATLAVGEKIHVEKDASLVLRPEAATPSLLKPTDPAQGFWMEVEGAIESRGEPRTEIRGLLGHGLDSVLLLPGGIKVNGTASLADVHIQRGQAGLIVGPGGVLSIENGTLEWLYLMGIASSGTVNLKNVEMRNNIIGVAGRMTCQLHLYNVTLDSSGGNVQVNRCPVTIESSRLLNGSRSVMVAGPTTVRITDTEILGYQAQGVAADGVDSRVLLDRVRIVAGWEGQHGIKLMRGSRAEVDGATIENNQDSGIWANGGHLRLHNSSLHSNRGYGVELVGGKLFDDPLADNDYGSRRAGSDNHKGAISRSIVMSAIAVDHDNQSVPGLSLEIISAALGQSVFSEKDSPLDRVQFVLDAYRTDELGLTPFLGPFELRASHPLLTRPVQITLPLNEETVIIELDRGAQPPSYGWPILVGILILIGAVVLYRRA